MATQLEQQGERVALLAVLNAIPDPTQRNGEQSVIEEADSYILLFSRHDAESVSEVDKYLWEKTRVVIQNNKHIIRRFSPRIYNGDMLFFRATVAQDGFIEPISPQAWQPYVLGNIEVHDIACKHDDMELPAPASHIAGILRQKLNDLQGYRSTGDREVS